MPKVSIFFEQNGKFKKSLHIKIAILMMSDLKAKCQICQNIYSRSSFKCSCLWRCHGRSNLAWKNSFKWAQSQMQRSEEMPFDQFLDIMEIFWICACVVLHVLPHHRINTLKKLLNFKHTSLLRGLCLMKSPSKMLQNLQYF